MYLTDSFQRADELRHYAARVLCFRGQVEWAGNLGQDRIALLDDV